MWARTRSTWISGTPLGIDVPLEVVRWFMPAPKASTQSACSISRRPPPCEKEPTMPQSIGWPRNMSLAFMVVASAAPRCSAKATSASFAPAWNAPWPAMISGRRLLSSSAFAEATAAARGACGFAAAADARTGAVCAMSTRPSCTSAGSSIATAPRSVAATASASTWRTVCALLAMKGAKPAACNARWLLKRLLSGPWPSAGEWVGWSPKISSTREPARCA